MLLQRITYVLNIFPKLSETFIASELLELQRHGVALNILSLLPPRDEPRHSFVRGAGLEHRICYDRKEFSNWIASFQPQLLHAHFATEATAAAKELAAEHSLPFTFTAHGYDIYRKAPEDLTARANAAKALITVSQANADYLRKRFDIPAAHIHIIPSGVDTTIFKPNGTRDARLIVCVARHVAVKNLSLLLRSCAKLRDLSVDFKCVLLGDGPCHTELLSLRDELRLTDKVDMPGAVEQIQVITYLQKAAIAVLSSDSEGMPVCLMEAAACGAPAVATAVGGIPELVRDGVTGVLTPPGDPERMCSALAHLLDNPALREEMGAAARVHVQSGFSLASQVDKLASLWATTLL